MKLSELSRRITRFDALPKPLHAEFRIEIILTNVRRVRQLLLVALPGLCALIYAVQIRNVLNIDDDARVMILKAQLLILGVLAGFTILFFLRPIPHSLQDKAQKNILFFVRTLQIFTVAIILVSQLLIYTLLLTNGHPVFFYQVLIAWAAALLIPPRSALLLGFIMFSIFATLTLCFTPPTEHFRFAAESLASSAVITVLSVTTSMILFRSAAREFNRRKSLEEQNSKISDLVNELQAAYFEVESVNQDLKSRQEILEEQAAEIEVINSQLHEQNETLSELNTEKSEIISVVAHDLKNPIAVVQGLAEILLEEKNAAPEYRQTISEHISTTAGRMHEMVNNLLNAYQSEFGTMQFAEEEFDAAEEMKKCIRMHHVSAEKKQITIHTDLETDCKLNTNKQAFIEVCENLLSNAIKYSPHGKNIYVRMKSEGRNRKQEEVGISSLSPLSVPLNIPPFPLPSFLRVEIQDEGPGISPEDMKKLFGKFVRLSARPTGGEQSMGLGLSIVKKMVEAMNGKVWCEPQTDIGRPSGATFIVELPKAE